MGRRPFTLLVLLALYLPLENFLLKWIPVSDATYLWLRQMPEAALAALFVYSMLRRVPYAPTRLPLIGGAADPALFAFVVLALAGVALNDLDPAPALANIKALLRYLSVLYVVMVLHPTEDEARRFGNALLLGAAIQLLLGGAQWAGGIPVRNFLAAREAEESLAGVTLGFTGARFESVNDLMGTLGNTINYAMFLLAALALWSARHRGARYWMGVALALLFVHLTGSRSSFIGVLVLVLAVQFLRHGPWRFAVLAGAFPLFLADYLFAAGVSLDRSHWTFVLSDDYLNMAMNQRLGIAVYVLPHFLRDGNVWFGLGADTSAAAAQMAQAMPQIPLILAAVLPRVIEDVFWLALLFYYGAVGLMFWLVFLIATGRRVWSAWRVGGDAEGYAFTALLLLILSVPLNLFNQAFEVRQFSFYLWAFVGLALARARAI